MDLGSRIRNGRIPSKQQQPKLNPADLEKLLKIAGPEAPTWWFLALCSVSFVALVVRALVGEYLPTWANLTAAGVGGVCVGIAMQHFLHKMHVRGCVHTLLWVERLYGHRGEEVLDAVAQDIRDSRPNNN